MAATRILSQEEREAVLKHVKPTGDFKPPTERQPFGVQPTPWEERLGDLNEWREHKGMGRAIVPKLANPAKTQSIQNSILARLRRLFPDESWSSYVDGRYIYLKFGGSKRPRTSEQDENQDDDVDSELFSEAN